MFGLSTLIAAVSRLAAALNGLAVTTEEINIATRDRLGMDEKPAPLEIEANGAVKRKAVRPS